MRLSSGTVLSANVLKTCRESSSIPSALNCVMAATQVPIVQATSSGIGSSPSRNDEDVITILHQQQTMHVAHNISNTIHRFSEGTQKGSLCTYSALCSITCCMNPQLGNITKGSVCVCVDSQRKEVMGTESMPHPSQAYTPNGCDEKVLQ